MEWKNLGDMNPKEGTFLVRNAELDENAFRAEAVEVIPDTSLGGSDGIFFLRQGTFFLDRKNFASALDALGARVDGRPNHMGAEDRFDLASEQGLLELSHAAMAFGGMENDLEILVMHGLPDIHQNPPQLGKPEVVLPETACFWAVMRSVLDGFDYLPPGSGAVAKAVRLDINEWDEYSPYAGLPCHVESADDLRVMPAIRAVESGEAELAALPEDLRALWESLVDREAEPSPG